MLPRLSFHLTAATEPRSLRRGSRRRRAGSIRTPRRPPTRIWISLGWVASPASGIYEVQAFESATGHTFPRTRSSPAACTRSRGIHARFGLVTDTELFDDFPARYHAYAVGNIAGFEATGSSNT